MYNPVSSYRIQFNKEFTFRNFKENLEYFKLLSPGSIYASPVFEAAPGSMHGYNVTNPNIINPEIGKYIDFAEISDELKALGIGWIQDIVPNHMAFHMNNAWLMDVLEKGRSSPYASFFDIDFDHPRFNGRLMVPFLGKSVQDAVNDGEIRVAWLNGSFIFRYFDFYFPFNFESAGTIFLKYLSKAPADFVKIWEEYTFSGHPNKNFLENVWPDIKNKFEKAYHTSESFRNFISSIVESVNSDKSYIEELTDQQHYLLCFWQDSLHFINYRRFFTVNGLICLRMFNDKLFETYHSFIGQQILHHRFQGLRIDHIDGLKKPLYYLEKLRQLAGDETYIVAEKILERNEDMTTSATVQGTSGYDFLGIVNNLFTYSKNYPALSKFYRKITGIKEDTEDIIYNKKKFILSNRMHGEWDNLCRMFDESRFVVYGQEITKDTIKQAIGEFLLYFPVYKIYSDTFPLSAADAELLGSVFERSQKRNPSISKSVNALRNVFLTRTGFDAAQKQKALDFYLRCMQFTGPLMAKGVEDTAMYYYNCFIAHNEVGDNPGAEGISVEEYHQEMIRRQKNWPMAMNATSTHDTKRGEDVRARLNILSELTDEWIKNVENWIKMNRGFKSLVDGSDSPTVNEEYFIYQTLTGVLPFDGNADEVFLKRIDEYLIKSLREAKTDTSWNEPNEDHEKAVIRFAREILKPGSDFLNSFLPFQQKVSNYGIINSLNQLMLKATCPGMPDFYQGTELWDLSMVDPDNRRPVNYQLRYGILKELIDRHKQNAEGLFYDLYMNRADARIKLWLTHRLMYERKSDPDLFLHGKYIPLDVKGKNRDHVLAFARTYKSSWMIVIVPLYLAMLPDNKFRQEPGFVNWEDTAVILPDTAPKRWDTSTGWWNMQAEGQLFLADIMKLSVPIFLKGKTEETNRYAGILTHISSLPGKYGTGDLGDEAYEFVDFLNESGQSFWQILPFNPVEKDYGFSPYSSTSAFAGNTMFYSPDILVRSGLLSQNSVLKTTFAEADHADFKKAIDFRTVLLEEAFCNFKAQARPWLRKKFDDFCLSEKYWLDDYVMFVILKQEFNDAPWRDWPNEVKNRDIRALKEHIEKYEWEFEKEKFNQFLFHTQWTSLKRYANMNGIRIIGDMSFYVNYDSADVWANPHLFKLDENKIPYSIAGVPPDYFSSTGQLWNMPVYNWDVMKENGYNWWLNRIKRNLEFCDVVRFDHFRGFSEYWEVPAGETTAINGRWTRGPGNDFFNRVKKEFPHMPFIAEDLGMIDDKVYKLRDDYQLPGMVVLQFAFGDNTPKSSYIPHNHVYNSIVYTGTHDNNTTKGWFINELKNKNKKEAAEYFGHPVNESASHLEFIRMAYASVAQIALIPVQDLLGLDERARLNTPSTSEKNWDWKLRTKELKKEHSDKLRGMALLFGRK